MQVTTFKEEIFNKGLVEKFVQDNHTFGAVVMGQPHKFSTAIRYKDDMVVPIKLKKRKVYKSKGSLTYSQMKLSRLIKPVFNRKIDNTPMLAYIPGRNPYEILKEECLGKKVLISFDIRKYYDSITGRHLYNSFKKLGFNHKASSMLEKISTVKTPRGYTLQQGSMVSPMLSNLVGYYYMDKPLQSYLSRLRLLFPDMEITYKRYCDNLFIFLDGTVPSGITDIIKGEVKNLIGFKTHSWRTIKLNHPKMHQQVLGMVMNTTGKVPKDRYKRARGILFNALTKGVPFTAAEYFYERNDDLFGNILGSPQVRGSDVDAMVEKFIMKLRGYVTHVDTVNKKQGLRLKKLLKAATILSKTQGRGGDYWRGFVLQRPQLDIDVFNKVKTYNNDTESLEDFLQKIT